MRLQKYLADAGVASRRKAEQLIREGKVSVNGKVYTDMGYDVQPGDVIRYEGKPVHPLQVQEYYAFYKPGGIVSTVSDPEGRKTIMAFYKGKNRVYPVGRLDYDSEGLMILTTDGDFAHRMMHPRYEKKKIYHVHTERALSADELDTLRKGVVIDGYQTRPVTIRVLDQCFYEFTLTEGRNLQIRKMIGSVGHEVVKLKRIAIGSIKLGSLRPGQMRALTKEEIE